MTMDPAPSPDHPRPVREKPKKPWPMIWVVIAILAYAAFQIAYFLIYGD